MPASGGIECEVELIAPTDRWEFHVWERTALTGALPEST